MDERSEFDALVAQYKPCGAVSEAGCACTGACLGHHLGLLRREYDHNYTGHGTWWSDQAHKRLLVRSGDSGRSGAALTAENYWTGAR